VDIGVKISGTAHAILISIAIFGAPIFSSDEENPIQISEVSLISLEEFELLTKENMPVFQSEPEPEVQEPELEPEVQEPEPEPEVQEPEPEPEVQRARSRARARTRSTRARARTRSARNY
jgi:outer membrane biosynthesis protein TonB